MKNIPLKILKIIMDLVCTPLLLIPCLIIFQLTIFSKWDAFWVLGMVFSCLLAKIKQSLNKDQNNVFDNSIEDEYRYSSSNMGTCDVEEHNRRSSYSYSYLSNNIHYLLDD